MSVCHGCLNAGTNTTQDDVSASLIQDAIRDELKLEPVDLIMFLFLLICVPSTQRTRLLWHFNTITTTPLRRWSSREMVIRHSS